VTECFRVAQEQLESLRQIYDVPPLDKP
jgi:hypothetical protein